MGFQIFNYIDDFISCEPPARARESFQQLLGMPVSQEKLFQPQVEVPCLGIMVNIQTGKISIPDDKLQDIKSECIKWLSKTQATPK